MSPIYRLSVHTLDWFLEDFFAWILEGVLEIRVFAGNLAVSVQLFKSDFWHIFVETCRGCKRGME